ncbi:putative transmembrane protein 183BP [Tubulanus polymorphus]|uniref:putative transmembrane protein 183BP n=1 Tax=Tubulanus polymorphus TaxID=672921 RepID=UPI003DA577F5
MPRTGKRDKKKRNGGQTSASNTDVTVYDFAHLDKTEIQAGKIHRAKKGASILSEVKQLCGQPADKVNPGLAWYERDIEDFDLLKLSISGTEENEDCSSSEDDEDSDCDGAGVVTNGHQNGAKKENSESSRRVYPVDFWFLLADYVYPEDVGRFARICQHSHYVVHTTHFWRKLYNRFLSCERDLPLELRPCSMMMAHGLRTRVIRALYIMYALFHERTAKPTIPFEDEIHSLEGGRCLLMWHSKDRRNYWHFYFKIYHEHAACAIRQSKRAPHRRHGNGGGSNHSSPARRSKDLLDAAYDLHDNAEDGCRLLQVTALNFISLPPTVMGLYLSKVYLNVSQGMRYHKLRLSFVSYSNARARHAQPSDGTDVLLDPVVDAKVFKWWHPKFKNTVESC